MPVHEDVVVCPHCGGRSGARPNALTTAESIELLASDLPLASLRLSGVNGIVRCFSMLDSGAAVVELGHELVDAVIAAADMLREHDPQVPIAIAHVRPRQLPTLKTVEPERVEPADPSAPPRILK